MSAWILPLSFSPPSFPPPLPQGPLGPEGATGVNGEDGKRGQPGHLGFPGPFGVDVITEYYSPVRTLFVYLYASLV